MPGSLLAVSIAQEGIRAAHPSNLLSKYIKVDGDELIFKGRHFNITHGIKFIAFGKAALAMTEALVKCIGVNKIRAGIVVAPEIGGSMLKSYAPRIELLRSTHPFVSDASVQAGRRALAFAEDCTKEDVVVCLISGGGSALLAHPVEGITLEEKLTFVNNLMGEGIAEREMNVVRKALSAIKGGKLAAHIAPAKIVNIILSDERTHLEEANASGPTVPNNSPLTPRSILEQAGLWQTVPAKLKPLLEAGRPLNSHDLKDVDIETETIKGREYALEGMYKAAEQEFSSVTACNTFFHETTHENVNSVAKTIGAYYRDIYDQARSGRHAVVACGEVIVKAKQETKGGRCQHLAALMIDELKEIPRFEFAAIASDGCDFIRGVQGVVISNETVRRITEESVDYHSFIKDTQTYELHRKLGSLVEGVYTGTNVNDLYVFTFQK